MKATLTGELLLLVGLLAIAYFLYVQQAQLVDLELELDRMRGALGTELPPLPVVSDNGEAAMPPPPKQRAPRKPKAAPGA